jgi:hypothetical protein
MRTELAQKVNREMFFLDRKNLRVSPVNVVAESRNSEMIETSCGRRFRVHTKSHSVFYSEKMAMQELHYLQSKLQARDVGYV